MMENQGYFYYFLSYASYALGIREFDDFCIRI